LKMASQFVNFASNNLFIPTAHRLLPRKGFLESKATSLLWTNASRIFFAVPRSTPSYIRCFPLFEFGIDYLNRI
jgi:hypothetical protein